MTLGHGFAEGELRGQRIVYDVRRRIQAHRQSAEGTVVESTAITRCGEGDPGRVHHIGERLRWVSPEERLCSKTQRMEHERYLDALRRVEAALHLWRAPNELVHIRGSARGLRVASAMRTAGMREYQSV